MNTPDTEWEKEMRGRSSFPSKFQPDIDLVIRTEEAIAVLKDVISSRDTYWKERVLAILAGHGKGCDQKYHAECIEMIREEITNEDNLK